MKRASYKPDASWRKNRLAARILLRQRRGILRSRDILVARALANDNSLSSRLISQALDSLQAPLKLRELAH